MVRPPTGGHLTMGETWDGEFMKAKIRQVVFELLAFLCLFLAIGADWSTWERYQMSTNQTVHKHFAVSGNQYVTPQVVEMAVNQAIEAAKRREDRNQTARAKVTVSVMGEKYTVENLQFDGFLSWKRKPIDLEAFVLEKAREIHRLAFEVQVRRLAMVETSFSPEHGCFSCHVWPANTTSFNHAFAVTVIPDLMARYSESESTDEDLASLAAAEQFLSGLLDKNEPFKVEEAAA